MKRSSQIIQLESRLSSEANPLFGVAMLKIALEMKKPGEATLEEVIESVLRRMHLSEQAFRNYLHHNGGLLKTVLHRKTSKKE